MLVAAPGNALHDKNATSLDGLRVPIANQKRSRKPWRPILGQVFFHFRSRLQMKQALAHRSVDNVPHANNVALCCTIADAILQCQRVVRSAQTGFRKKHHYQIIQLHGNRAATGCALEIRRGAELILQLRESLS